MPVSVCTYVLNNNLLASPINIFDHLVVNMYNGQIDHLVVDINLHILHHNNVDRMLHENHIVPLNGPIHLFLRSIPMIHPKNVVAKDVILMYLKLEEKNF